MNRFISSWKSISYGKNRHYGNLFNSFEFIFEIEVSLVNRSGYLNAEINQ